MRTPTGQSLGKQEIAGSRRPARSFIASHRPLSLALVINSILFAAYLWTLTQTTTISVTRIGDEIVAEVDGSRLAVRADVTPVRRVGVYVETPRVAFAPNHAVTGLARQAAGDFWARFGPAWQKTTVQRDDRPPIEIPVSGTLDVKWIEWDEGRLAMLGGDNLAEARDFRLQALLARPISTAGILLGDSPDDAVLLLLRPQNRDVAWWRIKDGHRQGPVVGQPWNKPAVAVLQDDIELLLWTQQAALALIAAIVLLGFALGVLRRPEMAKQGDPRLASRDRVGSLSLVGRVFIDCRLIAALSAAVLAAVAGYVALVVLEAMPHVQDDVTYLFQARVFALGQLSVPASPMPAAFEQEFVVNFAGRAFGKYPPGHSLLLLPGVLAGVPWLINPVQAGATAFVIYLIGLKVYGDGRGLFALLLAATSPFVIFMSGSMMAHATGLLFIALFTLFFLNVLESRHVWRDGLLAGLFLGVAFLTRPYTTIAIAAPFALYVSVRLVRGRGRDLGRFLPIVAGFVPMALLIFGYNYALTGDALKNPMELWWSFDKVGFGEGVGIRGAHTLTDGFSNAYRNLTELLHYLFGWPSALTLAPAMIPFLTLRAGRWDWLFLAASASLVVAHVAWWADGVMYGPRYYYETTGFLVLLAANGTYHLGAMAHSAYRRAISRSAQPTGLHPEILVRSFGYLAVGALIAGNIVFYLPDQWKLHQGYNYVSARSLNVVRDRDAHNALIFVDTGRWYEWWNYGSVFSANTPTLDGDVVFARDLGREKNRKVMDIYPGRRYYRLSGTNLEEMND